MESESPHKVSEKPVWRIIPMIEADGPTNMAMDEAILMARAENLVPNTIRFYRWSPSTASIGSHQSLSQEIDLEAAKRLNVGLVRRISGGGAVYHDNDAEITYSVIASETEIRKIFYCMDEQYFSDEQNCLESSENDLKKPTNAINVPNDQIQAIEINKHSNVTSLQQSSSAGSQDKKVNRFFGVESSYHVITRGLVNGLRAMGVQVDQGVIHCPALFINNKKISGNSQARRQGIILQHGTILLYVDPELMYTILKAPLGVTKGKMVQSVKTKVTGIWNTMDPVSDQEFQSKMIHGFEEALGIICKMGDMIDVEKDLINDIKKKRYSDNLWLEKIP
jgi:lipoate-protein ligase A